MTTTWIARDATGDYSPALHAASLTDEALRASIASAPASAIGSPLYVALLAERDARDRMAARMSQPPHYSTLWEI